MSEQDDVDIYSADYIRKRKSAIGTKNLRRKSRVDEDISYRPVEVSDVMPVVEDKISKLNNQLKNLSEYILQKEQQQEEVDEEPSFLWVITKNAIGPLFTAGLGLLSIWVGKKIVQTKIEQNKQPEKKEDISDTRKKKRGFEELFDGEGTSEW